MNALDLFYLPAAAVTAPLWARKARAGWRERFGRVETLGPPPAGKKRLLIHAVSVGETNAIRGLVPMLAPDVDVVVTATTDTGLARARALFAGAGETDVLRYPLDFSWCVERFLDAVRPDAVALVELELWPNFVRACERRSIPVCVINGRLSARSFKGYHRFHRFFEPTFSSLAFAAVQDEHYAVRFRAMGVPESRCLITGSMKWDAVRVRGPAEGLSAGSACGQIPGAEDLATILRIDRAKPLIVAGSTGPLPKSSAYSLYRDHAARFVAGGMANSSRLGEEALLDVSCPSGVQLLCAPRKPERAEDAAGGMPGCTVRRGRRDGDREAVSTIYGPRGKETDRFLLATIGELNAAYGLADLVVMGRSFGDLHGSDPIEPIAMGKPVVIGPAHSDFQTIVDEFVARDGIAVCSIADLPRTLVELMASPERRAELTARGQECIMANQGATRRHAGLLLDLLGVGATARCP